MTFRKEDLIVDHLKRMLNQQAVVTDPDLYAKYGLFEIVEHTSDNVWVVLYMEKKYTIKKYEHGEYSVYVYGEEE